MLTVHNLSYTYPGQTNPAVRQLNFEVAQGEIFGFLGPSGAGKSTTQKILIKLLAGYAGEVMVFGRDLRHWKQDYFEQVGVSFELPNHYLKLTGLENLRYFGQLYQRPTAAPRDLLQMVGLETDADRPVKQYSKGMRMRLNLARALLHQPALLFLDEPTSGLDPVNAQRVKQIVQEVRGRGTTIFITTHDMHVADALCDRVAFMVGGEIRLIDAPRALKLAHGRRSVRVETGANGHMTPHEFALTGLADNPTFLNTLSNADLQTIHTQETTLEEIFIQVTGARLGE